MKVMRNLLRSAGPGGVYWKHSNQDAIRVKKRPRKGTPPRTRGAVLAKCKRRCAICVAVLGRFHVKRGQIAHIDRDRSNCSERNLAFLCLKHHDEYDTRPSQSKGYEPSELTQYKAETEAWVSAGMKVPRAKLGPPKASVLEEILGEHVPAIRALMNYAAGGAIAANVQKEMRRIHVRLDRLSIRFHDESEIESTIKAIGNLGGSALSGQVTVTQEYFSKLDGAEQHLRDRLSRG